MGLRLAPLTAAIAAAVAWGGTLWLAYPSDRLRASWVAAAGAWAFIYLIRSRSSGQ